MKGGVENLSRINDVLTKQQSDLVNCLIEGDNITEISNKLGVSRQTVYDWMKRDIVKAELDKRRQEITRQATAMILKDVGKNIQNIQALANDPTDKRTALAANQYLINRIFGNPKDQVEVGIDQPQDNGLDNETILAKLNRIRKGK